jgi:L-alanine-DL-glutamate epimerase-like enolase superfamily enzyme
MKITDVEVIILEGPEPYRAPEDAEEAPGVRHLCLVKVSTDEGLVGWSDVETQPHVAKAVVEAPASGSGMFEGLRELAVGEDPFEVERLWDKLYRGSIYYGRRGAALQAISGIDIACWDIMGKATGRPVYQLLGAGYRDRVRAYASTLFRPTPAAMATAACRYVERGFTAIKFGWGVFGQDPGRDVELVAAAREAVGDEIELMVDAGWLVRRTPKEAAAMVRRLEPSRPYWIEEPLAPDDYDGYRMLAEAVSTPIAAGEQEATIWGFDTLIHRGRVDIVQPDLSRCGGFTVARKIADLAELRNVAVCPHAWLSDLLTAASLHLNAYLKRSLFLEFNVSRSPLLRELCREPIRLEDGWIRVPQGPGLGVEVNEEVVARYRVA